MGCGCNKKNLPMPALSAKTTAGLKSLTEPIPDWAKYALFYSNGTVGFFSDYNDAYRAYVADKKLGTIQTIQT